MKLIEMIQAVMFMYETIVNNGWQQQEQSFDKWRFSNQQTLLIILKKIYTVLFTCMCVLQLYG